jgi:hypothetical protein
MRLPIQYCGGGVVAALIALGCAEQSGPEQSLEPSDAKEGVARDTENSGDASAADTWEADTLELPPRPEPVTIGNAYPEGHPLRPGQELFFRETWGAERNHEWPPASFLLRLMVEEPSVFGDQFSKFGFTTDGDDDFPVGLKRGTHDPERVSETCALCHTGILPDSSAWLGLPTSRLDLGAFRAAVNERWVAAGNPPLATEQELKKLLQLGPGRTAADAIHSENELVVPADFPVYFNLGERTALNYMGTGKDVRTEIYFSIYTFGAGSPDANGVQIPFPTDQEVAPLVAFMGSLSPPPAPAQDPELVERGAEVFASARCSDCHHPGALHQDGVTPLDRTEAPKDRLPGDDPRWPKGSIATSPLHFGLQDAGDDEGLVAFIEFILAHGLSVGQTDGYRANDLRATWATAPYLHNGTVATLEELLEPASRRAKSFERYGFVVDTTLPNNDNRGHEFGVDLASDDKTALLAYLRSL